MGLKVKGSVPDPYSEDRYGSIYLKNILKGQKLFKYIPVFEVAPFGIKLRTSIVLYTQFTVFNNSAVVI